MGITVRRLALLVALSLAVVGGTSGCSDKTNGSAVPENTTTTEQQTTTGPTTGSKTSDQPVNDPLKDKDPCALLTSAGQSQLGISNGEKRQLGEARSCRWRQRGSTETFLFDVSIYDKLGIKDLPSDREIKQLPKVGKHEAVQRTEAANPGVCAVIMGVTESSRVSTQVTAGTDSQKGCQLAMQLAQLVEPELP